MEVSMRNAWRVDRLNKFRQSWKGDTGQGKRTREQLLFTAEGKNGSFLLVGAGLSSFHLVVPSMELSFVPPNGLRLERASA